jgi:hypothetical protein
MRLQIDQAAPLTKHRAQRVYLPKVFLNQDLNEN